MGGHGSLISALRGGNFKSASAFAPISNPTNSEWGIKAFNEFIGENQNEKNLYDSVEIVKSGNFNKLPLLIDVGQADPYWKNLGIEALKEATQKAGLKVDYKIREGYDHSFYYVSSFLEEHFEFHQKYLNV